MKGCIISFTGDAIEVTLSTREEYDKLEMKEKSSFFSAEAPEGSFMRIQIATTD